MAYRMTSPLSATPRWQGAQRRIGLTGGIASGKSSVGRHLAELGLPVLDADVYAHEALAPGSPGSEVVLQRYGPGIEEPRKQIRAGEDPVRSINRRALGQIVFNDSDERQWLEQLIHPLVLTRFSDELDHHQQSKAVVLVIPLLFEAGLTDLCSEIWVVDCSPEQQLARLQQRDGLDEASAKARIQAQWPLSDKCQKADLVLNNRGEAQRWQEQIRIKLGADRFGHRSL